MAQVGEWALVASVLSSHACLPVWVCGCVGSRQVQAHVV
jgi:hypothetical protein